MICEPYIVTLLILIGYEPEDLRAALVSDAEELEDEMLREWQESASTMEGEEAGFLQFMPLDPGRDRTFKGLDHATVPATPDMLITEGRGLQIFTKASKGTNKTIVGALGKDTGGAVMSFGRAVEMLGLPEGPGKDYDRESASTTEPGTDMSNVESLGPVLSSASLDDPPAVANDKATTESEWRERHPHSPPVLSQQQQLDIIGLKQLYLWSGNLANMYYKLATEQEKHEEEEELRLQAERDRLAAENEGADGENFAAPAVEEVMAVQPIEAVPSSKPASYPIGWPLVEKKDFAGYTNWLHALQKEDPKVHKTSLAPWIEQRNKRHGEIQTAIDSWKEPVTAQSQQLDTTRFYNGPPLLKVDMERAGIKTESVGLSGKGGKRT